MTVLVQTAAAATTTTATQTTHTGISTYKQYPHNKAKRCLGESSESPHMIVSDPLTLLQVPDDKKTATAYIGYGDFTNGPENSQSRKGWMGCIISVRHHNMEISTSSTSDLL